MKTKLFLGALLFSGKVFTQTFLQSMSPGGLIDISNNSNYNPGYSYCVNYENRVHNYETNVLNTYLTMYEATKNAVYLDRFVEHAKRVLDRRQWELGLHFIAGTPNFIIDGVPPGISVQYNQIKAWPTRLSPDVQWSIELITNGIIAKPLAQFAYMIKVKYPALATRVVPASAAGTDISGWYAVANYGDFAEMLRQKVDQTARGYFDQIWSDGDMAYYESITNFGDLAIPNCMTSLGRVHTYMYKIYEAENNVALRDYYLHKVRKIAQRLINPTQTNFQRDQVNHTVRWNYGALDVFGTPPREREDIAHGLIVMEFADLCNLFDIRGENNLPLFDNDLMYDFANTFKTKFISATMRYSMSITGVELDQRQIGYNPHETTFGSYPEGSVERYEQYINAGRFLFLARHIPDIYNMIADYFYEFSLYGPTGYPHYCNNTSSQIYGLDAVAQLAYGKNGYSSVFKNYLDIASVKRPPVYQPGSDMTGTEQWLGVVSGKFDANKTAHSIAAFNSQTGRIEIREFDAQKKISNVISSWNVPVNTTTPNWGSVTAGDIIPGNNCDEIVAFNRVNNYFYLFKQNGSAITLLATFSVGKNCSGIAAGNFNTTAGDEIIFLSKDDGRMYLYKFTVATNQFSQLAISNNALAAYVVGNPAGITVGNLDNNASNGLEIATINNNTGSDYNIKVYNLNSTSLAFESTVYQFTGTTGSYSQWDGITSGDFNADGFDELMLHRQYDGDFHIHYLDGGMIKSLCKENFPTNWLIGRFSAVKFPNDNREHLISLRNNDGHMFLFRAMDLPSISRPLIPIGPIKGMRKAPEESAFEKSALSADGMNLANEIQIYPNPSNGIVMIESGGNELTHVKVTTALGNKVYESQADGSLGRSLKIDLSEQPSGVYLVHVSINGKSTVKRVIKK